MVNTENYTMDDSQTVGCGCPACISSADNNQQYIDYATDDATADAPTGSNGPDQLMSGYVWNNDGNGVTLHYKFWTALPSYYSGADDEANGFKAFSAEQKTVAQDVLNLIETFTNITFVETTSEAQADLGFAQANLPSGVGAWAYYPGGYSKAGDVWTNRTAVDETGLDKGTYDYFTILHEVGHALGLQHTFDAGLTGEQNTEKYSVMAYDWTTWGAINYAQSYQLYDIYALQQLYGANTSYNAGNDTYALRYGDAYTIWDSGGIDTFDASAQSTAVTIDLNAGAFSSVGLTENIAIAYGVTIENATGGSGNDTIYGNDANNVILGGGGNDAFHGSLGDDTLNGQTGADTVIYNYAVTAFAFQFIDSITVSLTHLTHMFTDTVLAVENFNFTDGSFTFDELLTNYGGNIVNAEIGSTATNGTTDRDIINGNNQSEILKGLDGDDTIYGDQGADTIYGHQGDDTIYGGGWSDVIFGDGGWSQSYAGNDTIYGEAGNDRVNGRGGNDLIDGGTGHDVLYGHEGDDIIYGQSGSDYIYGGDGLDLLVGGSGSNVLYGNGNSDIFGFTSLSHNKVGDFTLSGAARDSLNITDILVGYDSATDDINNFVVLDYKNANQTNMFINANSSGGGWTKIATLKGSDFSGTTVDDLLASGQLITDTTLL